MRSEWIVKYENTEIKIVNTWFNGERLYVNNELQDERYGLFGSHLTGHLIDSNGARKNIKAHLHSTWSVNCIVFIDDTKMAIEQIL
jgi:hypothetical protein